MSNLVKIAIKQQKIYFVKITPKYKNSIKNRQSAKITNYR